jgi:hypothetical protein
MLPEAYINHIIPGRLRVKIPLKKRDTGFFEDIYQSLSACEGIKTVEVNPVTGSVLVIHMLDSKKIAAYAEEHNLFRIESVNYLQKQTYVSRKISETFSSFNKKVTLSTKGFANIPDLVLLALVGLSILQVSRGNFTAPAWYTAIWYALNIFLKAQPAEA